MRWRRSGEFDLVHNQMDWLPLAFDRQVMAPMVTTIHGFSGSGILPAYARSRSAFVAISESDRSPELDYAATIYHGVDVAALPSGRMRARIWWSSGGCTRTRAPRLRYR